MYPLDRNVHRPIHFYNGSFYFISGRTLDFRNVILGDKKKIIFKSVLSKAIKKFKIKLYAWVVLDNHYHLLFSLSSEEEWSDEMSRANFVNGITDFANAQSVTPNNKRILIEFIRKIHKDSARIFNYVDNTTGRRVWYQYWDWCIRNEEDFWYHFVYIVQNPLKHKLTSNWEETFNYKFSSNTAYLKNKSEAWLHDCLYYYPVKDWTPEGCE